MESLGDRTKAFSLKIIQICHLLPQTTVAQVICKQILRSGTSVGAHYREATQARSKPEFTAKIDAGLQELEETKYWLELLSEAKILLSSELDQAYQEANELTAILISVSKKVKSY